MRPMALGRLLRWLAGMGCILAAVIIVPHLLRAAGIVRPEERDFQDNAEKDEVQIFPDSGFYSESLEIVLSVPRGAKVYYTDNCEEPDEQNGTLYQGPIPLTAGQQESVAVYRFCTVYEDGTKQESVRTYFLGEKIKERYDVMILQMTGDPEGLFGYENGIFAAGKKWDEFWAANPDAHIGGEVLANWSMRGREAERPVYIQFFDRDGTLLLEQNGGVRIQGGLTRIKNQKSFRLYARKEYDRENEFDYPFFGDLNSEENGVLGREYKRLVVRSAGNDNGFGYVRSELVGRLARESGFMDTMSAIPLCVYINGDYKGIYWLENNYDGQYFENRYGLYTGEFVILEGTDKEMTADGDPVLEKYAEEYNRAYAESVAKDLTQEENYQELCSWLDVENYLQYFAIENYVGNTDWPGNNLKVYRYVAENEDYADDSVFDGKYRHLLYDVDFGFGLMIFNDMIGSYAQLPTLQRIVSENSPLFAALMDRQDCRDYFVNYTCDLMNSTMSQQYVTETVDEMHASRYQELYHMLEESDVMKGSLWESEESLHMDTVEQSIQTIKDFAMARPETVIADIQDTFDIGDEYHLNISKGDCCSSVHLNSFYVTDDTFSGTYFKDVQVRLEAAEAENETFVCWLVNGERREEKVLILDGSDVKKGEISVEMITEEKEEPVLQLSAVKAKGTNDYVEIVNRSHKVIDTNNYFLSDSDDLYKYALPVMSIAPGETLRIYGKDYSEVDGLGQLEMNFNLKAGEILSLTFQRERLDEVEIPDLSSEQGVYIRNFCTDRWAESF